MTKLDQLQSEVRRLEARLSHLEAAEAARAALRKESTGGASHRGYADIKQSEADRRWNLWTTYHALKILETCGTVYNRRRGDALPTSRAWFAANVCDAAGCRFSLRELERWFARRNTHPVGSRQDLRIRRSIEREIGRMRGLGYYFGMPEAEASRLHAAM
jgi:hypothetical protein